MTMVPMGGNKVSANPELMEKHPEVYTSMGATAENVAARFERHPRGRRTRSPYESQRRAATAREQGKLQGGDRPRHDARCSTRRARRSR